jgi:hypothetical protein
VGPAGTPACAVRYGVRFRWALSYDEMREILFEKGLFDVRVIPGMTVPDNLDAPFSLHSKARMTPPARTSRWAGGLCGSR